MNAIRLVKQLYIHIYSRQYYRQIYKLIFCLFPVLLHLFGIMLWGGFIPKTLLAFCLCFARVRLSLLSNVGQRVALLKNLIGKIKKKNLVCKLKNQNLSTHFWKNFHLIFSLYHSYILLHPIDFVCQVLLSFCQEDLYLQKNFISVNNTI